jgi:hypothetical protein
LHEGGEKLGRAHASREPRDFDENGRARCALEGAAAGEDEGQAKPCRVQSAERLDALEGPLAPFAPQTRDGARGPEKRKRGIGGDDEGSRAVSLEIEGDFVQDPGAEDSLSARHQDRRGAFLETRG